MIDTGSAPESQVPSSPLAAAFALIAERVRADPCSDSAKALIEVVAGVLLGRPIDALRVEKLLDVGASRLGTAFVGACLDRGMSEDERVAFVTAMGGFFLALESGTLH